MMRISVVVLCLGLASCATNGMPADTPTGQWMLVLPDELAAHLRQGRPLRFGTPGEPLPLAGDLEHCGQICHTYRICDSSSPPCYLEKICVDNPKCDGHTP